MVYSRRDFARLALAVPVAGVVSPFATLRAAQSPARAGARFGGLNVGVIAPYSFRAMANTDADALLTYVVQLGLGAVELQSTPAEAFAGARKCRFDDASHGSTGNRTAAGRRGDTGTQ